LAAGGWIARSVSGTVAELASLHDQFGVMETVIVDDEFFGGTEAGFARAVRFGSSLEQLAIPLRFAISCRAENVRAPILEQLQRGGLSHVFIGLESGVAEDLRLYAKGHSSEQNRSAVGVVKSLGLSFQPGFMLFNHRSTIRDVRANLEFLQSIGECKPTTINTVVDPHFGTPLTQLMESEGVLRDYGLAMRVEFLDERVRIAKLAVEIVAFAFQPYMNLIADLQSSVTYEWRRQVPGRLVREKRLIDAYESSVNAHFADVVVQAVEELDSPNPPETQEVISVTNGRVATLEQRLKLPTAILLAHLSQVEGKVHHWSQEELIQKRTVSHAEPRRP
jgi:hypothetical protein